MRASRFPRSLRLLALGVFALLALGSCAGSDDGGSSSSPTGGDSSSNGSSDNGSSGNDGGPTVGGELVLGFPTDEARDVPGLDPQHRAPTTFGHSIITALFDQVVYQDPTTGEIVGGLAESWDISDDGRTYTFHLKTEPRFWDGTPVTAEDVKYTLDRAVDPDLAPNNAYQTTLAVAYSGSTVIDDHTIEIQLDRPQANFLPSVLGRSYFAVVQKSAVEAQGLDDFSGNPKGSGPFIFEEWVRGDHITVRRNPDYTWGPEFLDRPDQAPMVETITFRFIPEPSTRVGALRSGQLNAMIGLPPLEAATFEADSSFKIVPVQKNGQAVTLIFNVERGHAAELAVREAIAHGIDRAGLNRAIYAGTAHEAYFLLEERMGDWVNQDARLPGFDPDEANRILDDAGWVVGSDGVRERDGERLTLEGLTVPELQQFYSLIQDQLRSIGVELRFSVVPSAQVVEVMRGSGEFDFGTAYINGWTNEDPALLYTLYAGAAIPGSGTGITNVSRYSDPIVDDLLGRASGETDEAARREMYHEVQEIVVAAVPEIPLISVNQNIVTTTAVNGLVPDYRGTYTYFHDVWIEQ